MFIEWFFVVCTEPVCFNFEINTATMKPCTRFRQLNAYATLSKPGKFHCVICIKSKGEYVSMMTNITHFGFFITVNVSV